MKVEKAELYTWPTCPYCNRAKGLLDQLHISYTDHDIWGNDEAKRQLIEKTGQTTVPYVFINDRFIGGCDDLLAIYQREGLE
ncbi:MAG: glutaredoxin family protein [Pseudoramibacter sp.]